MFQVPYQADILNNNTVRFISKYSGLQDPSPNNRGSIFSPAQFPALSPHYKHRNNPGYKFPVLSDEINIF